MGGLSISELKSKGIYKTLRIETKQTDLAWATVLHLRMNPE